MANSAEDRSYALAVRVMGEELARQAMRGDRLSLRANGYDYLIGGDYIRRKHQRKGEWERFCILPRTVVLPTADEMVWRYLLCRYQPKLLLRIAYKNGAPPEPPFPSKEVVVLAGGVLLWIAVA